MLFASPLDEVVQVVSTAENTKDCRGGIGGVNERKEDSLHNVMSLSN